jgi:hypothetical protein
MKNFLWLALLFSTMSFAETSSGEHLKMFPEGRKWSVAMWGHDDPAYTLIVHGDTVVNEKSCKKIYQDTNTTPNFIVYEEDGVIYAYSPEEKTFVPRMDFTLNKGDEITEGYSKHTVVDKDTVSVNGVKRCRITISPGIGNDKICYWVEGIGASCEVWYNQIDEYDLERPIAGFLYMVACYDDDTLLFSRDDFSTLSSGIRGVTANPSSDTSPIYDTSGRAVSHPQKGNIYISQGKKFLEK